MIIYSTHHAVREAMGDDDVAWIRRPRWPETIHLDMLVAGNVGLDHWKTRKTLTEITKRKIRTNQETEKTLDEMGKHSEKQISDPSADKTWWNKMQKHTKRKNVPAIGEIQRESRGRTAHSSYRKLERFWFFHIFPASVSNLHRLDTVTLGSG
jgi:hypothetical protein